MQTSLTPTLDELNPLAVLRTRARNKNGMLITQAELARLCQVSEQFITRQESGLINQPSARVTERLLTLDYDSQSINWLAREGIADISIASDLLIPEELRNSRNISIGDWFTFWQQAKRHQIGKSLVGFESSARNLAGLINELTVYLGRPQSVYEFCRILAIHIYTAQSQLSDSQVTGVLREALEQAGIKWGYDVS